MKIGFDSDAILWLAEFAAAPFDFDWDAGNLTKNRKHGVEPEEVESLFLDPHWYFAGRILEPESREWRGLMLAADREGRELALIFTRRGNSVRPISCRRMRDEEKKVYRENGPGRAERPGH